MRLVASRRLTVAARRDDLAAWLDPKPPAYRPEKETIELFKEYLPG